MDFFQLSWAFVVDRTALEVIGFLWFLMVFDVPRYFLGFASVFLAHLLNNNDHWPQGKRRRLLQVKTIQYQHGADDTPVFGQNSVRSQVGASHTAYALWPGRASVLIAAHNEAQSIEHCVRSLRNQQGRRLEIVCVDDGSSDGTYAILQRLKAGGWVDTVVRVADRGGKSAAINLAASLATGDALVVVDSDCTFEPHAIEHLLAPLADAGVGAVGGSVLVRNSKTSVMASIQAIEYLFSVHLGRTLFDYFGLVTCVSGAFGVFRRDAWQAAGGMDVGPGEDFDITMRLRQKDYCIRFASEAVAWTDVPETLSGFLRQRRRWERDAIRIRLRKFGFTLNPFDTRFRLTEALHQLEFLTYSLIAGLGFALYVVWVASLWPALLPVLLLITVVVIVVLDLLTLLVAALVLRRFAFLQLIPFVPLFAPFQLFVMRNARILAYFEELIFSTSRADSFVPTKVRRWHW